MRTKIQTTLASSWNGLFAQLSLVKEEDDDITVPIDTIAEGVKRLRDQQSQPSNVDEEGPATPEELNFEEIAAIEFEACDGEILEPFTAAAWRAESLALGQHLRIAAHALTRTKPQLLEGVRNLLSDREGEDALRRIIDGLLDTTKRFNDLAEFVDAAVPVLWRSRRHRR